MYSPQQIHCKSEASFNKLLDFTLNEKGLSIAKEQSGLVILQVEATLEERQHIERFELLSASAYGSSYLDRVIRKSDQQQLLLLHTIAFARKHDWLSQENLSELVSTFQANYNSLVDYHWLFLNIDFTLSYEVIHKSSADILQRIISLEDSLNNYLTQWKKQNSIRIKSLSELSEELFKNLKAQNAHSKDEDIKQVFLQFQTLQDYVTSQSRFKNFQKLKKPMNSLHLYDYIIELKTLWLDIIGKVNASQVKPWFEEIRQLHDSYIFEILRELHLSKSTHNWNDIIEYNIDAILENGEKHYQKSTHPVLDSIEIVMAVDQCNESSTQFQILTSSGNSIDLDIDENNGINFSDIRHIVFSSQLTHTSIFKNANIFAQSLIMLDVKGIALMSKDEIAFLLFDARRNSGVENELVDLGYKSIGIIDYDIIVESFVDMDRSISIYHYEGLINYTDLSNPIQQSRILDALTKYGVIFKTVNLDD